MALEVAGEHSQSPGRLTWLQEWARQVGKAWGRARRPGWQQAASNAAGGSSAAGERVCSQRDGGHGAGDAGRGGSGAAELQVALAALQGQLERQGAATQRCSAGRAAPQLWPPLHTYGCLLPRADRVSKFRRWDPQQRQSQHCAITSHFSRFSFVLLTSSLLQFSIVTTWWCRQLSNTSPAAALQDTGTDSGSAGVAAPAAASPRHRTCSAAPA